jgi:hypothetical protein
MNEVIGEAVIIIDHQDHGRNPLSLPLI